MEDSLHIAVREVLARVHQYMREHPESELHRCGKMFGVLVVKPSAFLSFRNDYFSHQPLDYLAAFSAKLDGSYFHEGFVPPVYAITEEPIGTSKEESKRLQRLLFANYNFLNGRGESKNILDIFRDEKPIIPPEEWFSGKELKSEGIKELKSERMPPSGAGECCGPKLLQR